MSALPSQGVPTMDFGVLWLVDQTYKEIIMIRNSMFSFKGIRNNMKGTLQFVLLTHFMNLKIVLF